MTNNKNNLLNRNCYSIFFNLEKNCNNYTCPPKPPKKNSAWACTCSADLFEHSWEEYSWWTCLQSLPFSLFISIHFWEVSVITRNSYLLVALLASFSKYHNFWIKCPNNLLFPFTVGNWLQVSELSLGEIHFFSVDIVSLVFPFIICHGFGLPGEFVWYSCSIGSGGSGFQMFPYSWQTCYSFTQHMAIEYICHGLWKMLEQTKYWIRLTTVQTFYSFQYLTEISSLEFHNYIMGEIKRTKVAQHVKDLLQFRKPGFSPWVGKIPWRRQWQLTPVLLAGEFHGRRDWEAYSPWGCKESDTTEGLTVSVFSRR